MKNLQILIVLVFFLTCNKRENASNVAVNTSFYDKGYYFLENNIQDSAFVNFEKARIEFNKSGDSLKIAKCYSQMAIILCAYGDYFGSEEQSVNAIKFLDSTKKEDKEVLVSNINNIGIVNLNLKNYEKAIQFFKKSEALSNEPLNKISVINNEGYAYEKLRLYKQAINTYQQLLDKTILTNEKNKATIITNIAFTKFLQNPNYNAEPELISALNTRIKINDLWGQNASHAHLSDFYENKDREKSLFHAHEMFRTATQLKSPDDRLEALQKLVLLENPEDSHQYFKIYQKLNDSLQTARAKAKNQFAFIRYETEKNKADLLSAQSENEKKENRLILTYIFVLLLLATIVAGIFWYKKRKIRLEQEKELEVKNTALNYSKKVHDVVANGLYQTMVEVQNQDAINKEKVLDKLEDLYEKSRDISKEGSVTMLDFHRKIFEKLNAYSSTETKVFIVGNNPETWENISEEIKKELLNVLQELLVNMKKHSGAKLVSIKFEKDDNILKIRYLDNGAGIDFKRITKGSGMQNMENRIEGIGGSINFEKNPAGGLIAHISIPTNYV